MVRGDGLRYNPNMTRTLIRNSTVVLPDATAVAHILIADGKIAEIDPAVHSRYDESIDARGLHLIPGIIDDQVHFREPGLTHKEDISTASRACAKGGVTTYLEMPNTLPTTTSNAALHAKLDLAARNSLVNYGFYVGATLDNLHELKTATRTPGIKIFMGSSTGDLLVDDQQVLEQIFAETTLPITAHCEDETTIRNNRAQLGPHLTVQDHSRIRDRRAAVVATRRAVDLARRHRHRFHVLHVSTADECELFAENAPWITAEACPHHLLFSESDYDRLGTLIQANPSVKTAADSERLWQALLRGEIQVIATDHAPHTLDEKQLPYPESPSGIPCVENSLALMLHQVHLGRCKLEHVVQWMCTAPALVWDIVGKGRIEVGYDADLVLVDLQRPFPILNPHQLTKCGWSPWHGETLIGAPVRTWVRGRLAFADGKVLDDCRGDEALFDHSRGGFWAARA